MVSVYDVPPSKLIELAAQELKKMKELQPPEWTKFVKTGTHKERAPDKEDWWYTRCAAILRTVYVKGPIGVERLRTKYGGRKRRGVKPAEFRKGSGSIARKALMALEAAGLVEKMERKGRVITPKGKSFLDKLSARIMREKNE